MTLIVEDGSGVENANSYISIAEADAYFVSKGEASWDAKTTAEKENAIIVATLFVDSNFNWKGYVANETQGLSFPRDYLYDHEGREIANDKIPLKLKNAVCEMVNVHLQNGSLFDDEEELIKKLKVSSIEVEYRETEAKTDSIPEIVKALLKGFYVNTGIKKSVKNSSIEVTR